VCTKLPNREEDPDRQIRIAVLDTGIDLTNPFFLSKMDSIKCWPDVQSCIDTDGHGSHVAFLIQRIAPHVQLHVAKISDGHGIAGISPSNIAKVSPLPVPSASSIVLTIAEAIRHFVADCSPGRWIHAINISFGFPKYHDYLAPVRQAVCAAQEKGVLIFAAAGNDGRNSGPSWPAVLSSSGVISVGATNAYGTEAPFSCNIKGQLCAFGEDVWGPPSEKSICRSGTSFATPIAVATAAIVLGYVESQIAKANLVLNGLPSDFLEGNKEGLRELYPRLRTAVGMTAVLKETCAMKEAPTYIAPWFFFTT
jgi:subtilisin family serine protease